MSTIAAQPETAAPDTTTNEPVERDGATRAPICYIVDADDSIRHFLSLVLHGAGLDTEEFADNAGFPRRNRPPHARPGFPQHRTGIHRRDRMRGRARQEEFSGYVQLMSSRGSAVLEHVKSLGQQQRLQMLASLKKPFETSAVLTILQDLRLGHPPALATRIELQDALRHNWIEFWYQPKIDLRKKQLVGVEAFARARHPQNGVLLPGAFMPGAKEPDLIKLSELALEAGLKANLAFAGAWGPSAPRGQHSGQRAGQGRSRRHRADLSSAIREVAGHHYRSAGRADRHRTYACQRNRQKTSAARHLSGGRRIRSRLFLAGAGQGVAVCGAQARRVRSSPIAAPTRSTRQCARL